MWIATRRGKLSGLLENVGQEVDEITGEAHGKGVDRISEIGVRASEGQVTGVYGTGGSLARIEVSYDKELTEVGRMTEDS